MNMPGHQRSLPIVALIEIYLVHILFQGHHILDLFAQMDSPHQQLPGDIRYVPFGQAEAKILTLLCLEPNKTKANGTPTRFRVVVPLALALFVFSHSST